MRDCGHVKSSASASFTSSACLSHPSEPSSAPLVSFLALCHRHAPYVLQCLESIEAQQWPNAEVIILDNASDDGSAEIIQAWAAQTKLPVQLMMETQPRGICANANLLMARARGEFVASMATDDYWFPDKTARQVADLQRLGPKYAVAYSDAIRVDAAGTPLPIASFISAHRNFPELPSGDVLDELVRGPFIPAMSTMIRRQALLEMGSYDEHLVYEDYDAWLRIATNWHFHADPEPLCAYRVLQTSAIQTIAAQSQPLKLLSDAIIMARTARIERIATKVRINTLRRVTRLAIELVAHEGQWAEGLRSLHVQTGLSMLSLLASAQEARGVLTEAQSHQLLGLAIHHGILTATSIPFLPVAAREHLDQMDDEHSLRSSSLVMPAVVNKAAWENLYRRTEEIVNSQTGPQDPWWIAD